MTKIVKIVFTVFACFLLSILITTSEVYASPRNPPVQDQGVAGDEHKGTLIVSFAKGYLGVPYLWGGRGVSGFDCSGFIYYIFTSFGYEVPRAADEQYEVGVNVPLAELQPGDLVFFSTYEPGPSHVGIFIGEGAFIHASSAAGKVTITPLTKDYYSARFIGARRLVK